jgi:phenylalanyl-tRNA synthetase beta chain
MLASQRELSLGDNHEGILEIDEEIAPGTTFAEAFNLNDHIIDVENKMFTHRPDCFGLLGVYREIAGIRGQKFVGPEWYGGHKYDLSSEAPDLPLKIENELPQLVPRFMAAPMSGITVGPSPLWLQIHLARVGLRSINNIVDITNYVMYLTGQPLHAYDYDKVRALTAGDAAEITVRYPHSGEKITLLSGKVIEPRAEAIMIASGDHLIGVGGVMGGLDTEVGPETTNIILEVATFDMYSIRRTAMAHGLFTDAVTRFNKGQSPLQNPYIIAKAVHEVRTLASGKLAGQITDVSQIVGDRAWVHPPVTVARSFINQRLGFDLPVDVMKTLLENVEFGVVVEGEDLTVTAPFWRTDVETREDVVEEIGRLYGFDKLPLELPKRTIQPADKDPLFALKSSIRSRLAAAGANEVLTYSFVHGDLLQKAGQDPEQAFQIGNALSPDLQYYRLSITPSLLDKIHMNQKAGYDDFALFEIGKAHSKTELDEQGLPREFERLSLVLATDAKTAAQNNPGAPYYRARLFAERIIGQTTDLRYEPVATTDLGGHELLQQMTAPYDPARSAYVYAGDQLLGVVGEFKRSVARALKLPDFCAGFELLLARLTVQPMRYEALPRFPKVMQDITLKVSADTPVGDVMALLEGTIRDYRTQGYYAHITLIDIYQGEDTQAKHITYRLSIASHDRTLTDTEVGKILDDIATAAQQAFGAGRI